MRQHAQTAYLQHTKPIGWYQYQSNWLLGHVCVCVFVYSVHVNSIPFYTVFY